MAVADTAEIGIIGGTGVYDQESFQDITTAHMNRQE